METVIAAVVAGGFALVGTVITVKHNNQKLLQDMKAEFAKEMAIMECRVDELTREVREHNNFARRMPALEERVSGIDEKIKILHSN